MTSQALPSFPPIHIKDSLTIELLPGSNPYLSISNACDDAISIEADELAATIEALQQAQLFLQQQAESMEASDFSQIQKVDERRTALLDTGFQFQTKIALAGGAILQEAWLHPNGDSDSFTYEYGSNWICEPDNYTDEI